jgi:hypothetical protein
LLTFNLSLDEIGRLTPLQKEYLLKLYVRKREREKPPRVRRR